MRIALAGLLLAGVAGLSAAPAGAIDSCKVKVDKKTGVLSFDARNVQGQPTWGFLEAFAADNSFFNNDSCIAGGKAKKCLLADPDTLEARTPPAACVLYVQDETDLCESPVPGCVPAVRPVRQVSLIRNAANPTANTLLFEGRAFCDNDEAVIAGGYEIVAGQEFVTILGSFPRADDAPEWVVKFSLAPGDTQADVQVWAMCAR